MIQRESQILGGPTNAWIEKTMIKLDALAQRWSLDLEMLDQVTEQFPFKMTRYVYELIRYPGDPVWRQAVPDAMELIDHEGWEDPLAEESLSPVPNLVHRYPGRVLWLVSQECAMHCRFCTRKRRWRERTPMTREILDSGLDYICRHKEVNDVLLSGGDPLLLPIERLHLILQSLRNIPHVEVIRIGTRVPVVAPRAVTRHLADMLARHHPVYMNLHFNHPWEVTDEVRQACTVLANAGIPLASQTVLLRGINDEPDILAELFQTLLTLRVRPYYLMQMDLTRSTAHFRTPISTGLKIMHSLRNHISGLSMPHFVVDLPGGNGKVPLIPNYIKEIGDKDITFRNYRGKLCKYPLLKGEDKELSRWMDQPSDK